MSKTNQDLIYMHLDEFIREHPDQTWCTLLGYCLGYYNIIDLDILFVVQTLQQEGKIK